MRPPLDLLTALTELLRGAAARLAGWPDDWDPLVRPADPRFGDLQANGVLALAKQRRENPRELAGQLAEALRSSPGWADRGLQLEVSGPGFLTFRLQPEALAAWLTTCRDRESLAAGLRHLRQGRRVLVDYSSPNTAKEMHVGHIRSTVLGEALARILSLAGAEVLRDNHLGDWGTQFGLLLAGIRREGFRFHPDPAVALRELEDLYRRTNQAAENHPSQKEEARRELVLLQEGDEERYRLWEEINRISRAAYEDLYKRLGVHFDLTLGESFYRDQVARIYEELAACDVAEDSEGALVVFHREHPRFAEQPLLIRKSDGASNYATTDLAAVLYRTEELGVEEMVYVTDGRQQDHFEQLFLTVRKWYRATGRAQPFLHHVWFGTILGEDGKAIRTRSGESLKLKELLDEAESRARAVVEEKNPALPSDEKERIARAVGVGAVRYADLLPNRTHDYTFAWDRMLSFEGNTAPYLLYAVARLHALFRKAGRSPADFGGPVAPPATEAEATLARKMVLFPHTIAQVLQDLRPHFLCTYLYELAETFSTFYNHDRVLGGPPGEEERRLALCARTLLLLETGLHALGLETLERM